MTTPGTTPPSATVTATPALVRVAVVVGGLLGLAVLTARLDLVVMACPFVVAAWWAARNRRRRVGVGHSAATASLREGQELLTWASGPDGWQVSVAVPPAREVATRPALGGASGLGRAEVGLQPARWGTHQVDAPSVLVEDPSHSWRGLTHAPSLRLVVQPDAQTLVGSWGVRSPLGMSGIHTSRTQGFGTEVAQVRPFAPGDRLARINWRVTQRTGQVHTTATHVERDTPVLVVLDTTVEVWSGDDPAALTNLDLSVRATSAVAGHYLAAGDRVGLHDLGRRTGSVRAGAGPRQRRVVAGVLAATVRGGEVGTVVRPAEGVRAGMPVFVVTPLLGDDVVAEVVRLARLGAQVIVIDTLPPALGSPDQPPRTAQRGTRRVDEAWLLRRLERDVTVNRVERLGVPVVAWSGPASLATVLARMERARRAPRRMSR